MKKILLLSIFISLPFAFVKAQVNSLMNNSAGIQLPVPSENYCVSDEMTKELYKKYPERKKRAAEIDGAIYEVMKNASSPRGSRGVVYTIPVVVHIIHNNGTENISNAQVIQGIQDLNEAFSNTGFYQDANGVDVEIQFCLAQRDPNGNATNGITRDVSTLTNMTMETDDITLKNINRWAPLDYLNIWLVNGINSISSGSGVVGYAVFPSSHGQVEDGIVNEASYFGSSKFNSAVHVHEVGHYLGLHHTFYGGCKNNNCLLDGDQVCDTPPDNSTAIVQCSGSINTCTTDDDDLSTNNPFRPIANGGMGDQNDLFQDHMDYGDLACHKLYTSGQKDRMRTALTVARTSLLTSIGCQNPCLNPISVSITASATTVPVGTNVNFINATTGGTSYNWSISNVSFSTSQNASYAFNSIGNYWVVLTVNNNDPNCKKQDSVLIKVECSAQATYTASATSISPGGQVTFTSTSTGATTYQWYIDGVAQVTTPNFTHTFPAAGGFMVYLVACNANCCDTSIYQFIKVGLCVNKEANIWHFGDHLGLNFDNPAFPTNVPWVINSGQTSPGSLFHIEGTSCISDSAGALLFYTDGVTVWTKNNSVMQNGTGLWGNVSTTQSALIVKQPGSKSVYYIFTCDIQAGVFPSLSNGVPGAYAYSIVDMSLAGGLGSVISKNNLLYTATTEKQSAVRHANGTDIWLVSHEWNSNKFHSYLLTCNGLVSTPVISQSGFIHAGGYASTVPPIYNGSNSAGQMAISQNGRKLALAIQDTCTIEIFDFNTQTGVVSNPITYSPFPNTSNNDAYGVEFSPDGGKLYCSIKTQLWQLDLNAGSAVAIINSAQYVGGFGSANGFGLRLGPDGKVYFSRHDYSTSTSTLGAIQNPNALGAACNYNPFFRTLATNSGIYYSFPTFLVGYVSSKQASKIQGDTIICNTSTFYIKNNCGVNGDSIHWIFNGNSTIISKVDSAITINPTQVGVDTLISIQYATCGVVSDTLLIHTKKGGSAISLGNDTTICNPNAFLLDAGSGFNSYLWSTTAITQTINVLTPGIYWVEVIDTSGCKSSDTIQVVQGASKPNVNLGADKITCPGKVIPLDAGAGYMNYNWFDNSNGQTNTVWLPGTYWITVKDSCGNISTDTIKVIADYSGAISVGSDTALCDNDTLLLNAGNGFISYLWQDGNTNQTYMVIDSGTYIVNVTTIDGCAYTDSITINIKTDCNPTVNIDDCEIGVPDAFSPNGDGLNDELHVLGNCIDKITLIIYDRWGEKVFETSNPTQGWDGYFKGKKMDNAVFAYYLKVTTFKGTTFNLKGNISLVK